MRANNSPSGSIFSKFQEEDGLDHGAIVERPGSDAVERQTAVIRPCATEADEDAAIFSWGVFDGIAALVANGSEDLLERAEAFIADGNAGRVGSVSMRSQMRQPAGKNTLSRAERT
jgi:hypothetical protein